jgi:hypothetical protein
MVHGYQLKIDGVISSIGYPTVGTGKLHKSPVIAFSYYRVTCYGVQLTTIQQTYNVV